MFYTAPCIVNFCCVCFTCLVYFLFEFVLHYAALVCTRFNKVFQKRTKKSAHAHILADWARWALC